MKKASPIPEHPIIAADGTAWVHTLNEHKYPLGSVFGWSDRRSETGLLSGIVIDHGTCSVQVKDIRAGILK